MIYGRTTAMSDKNVRNTVLGSFFWKFGERILSQGISFVISLILARLLMPSDYGTIAMITIFINLSSVFINSGFASALIQKKDADSTDFSTMFYCSLVCALIIYGILFLAAPWIAAFYKNPALRNLLRVFALQIPLSVYNTIQMAYVSRHMLFRKVFAASFINTLVSGTLGIAMALSGFGVWSLVAQSLAYNISNSIVLSFFLPWRPERKFSKASAKSMMAFGSRVFAADLSGTFFHEIRSLIVGRVYTSADLAFYNKGQQLPELITNNLSNIFNSVMFPALANQSDHPAQLKQMTRRAFRLLSYILVPCMFGLSAVMNPLIPFLFTDKWNQTIPYGQILAVGLCINLIGDFPNQVLKAIGRSDVLLGLEVKKKPVYLLLIILGVWHSVYGLAIAVLAYAFYAMAINLWQMKKYVHYEGKEQVADILPSVLLGCGMWLVVMVLPVWENQMLLTLIVKVAVGALVYVAGSVLFKIDSFMYIWNLLKSYRKKK